MAKECAGHYVYSRKPAPSLLSGHTADWDVIRQDIENTVKTAGECSLEIVMEQQFENRTKMGKYTRFSIADYYI